MNASRALTGCQRFLDAAHGRPLDNWLATLGDDITQILGANSHGDFPRWNQALEDLPQLPCNEVELQQPCISGTSTAPIAADLYHRLEVGLQQLCPWRKGPFSLFNCQIDSEWRCNRKWQRLAPHLHPLAGRQVLDLGCGNGYYCLRLLGAGAESVVGFDPNLLFNLQFQAINYYLQQTRASVLPFAAEQLTQTSFPFDTVLSMGVLYHRRDPAGHLQILADNLRPGGQLVLETLILPDSTPAWPPSPPSRYANMRNVWYLPRLNALKQLVSNSGFNDVIVADISHTRIDEQRRTNWMHFHSLAEALDPRDSDRTIEGHPAPCRAIVTAVKSA